MTWTCTWAQTTKVWSAWASRLAGELDVVRWLPRQRYVSLLRSLRLPAGQLPRVPRGNANVGSESRKATLEQSRHTSDSGWELAR